MAKFVSLDEFRSNAKEVIKNFTTNEKFVKISERVLKNDFRPQEKITYLGNGAFTRPFYFAVDYFGANSEKIDIIKDVITENIDINDNYVNVSYIGETSNTERLFAVGVSSDRNNKEEVKEILSKIVSKIDSKNFMIDGVKAIIHKVHDGNKCAVKGMEVMDIPKKVIDIPKAEETKNVSSQKEFSLVLAGTAKEMKKALDSYVKESREKLDAEMEAYYAKMEEEIKEKEKELEKLKSTKDERLNAFVFPIEDKICEEIERAEAIISAKVDEESAEAEKAEAISKKIAELAILLGKDATEIASLIK